MRKLLGSVLFISLCFCNTGAFADDVSKSPVAQGNQGYVCGSPPKADETTVTCNPVSQTDTSHPIGDIINTVERVDDWIQQNLW